MDEEGANDEVLRAAWTLTSEGMREFAPLAPAQRTGLSPAPSMSASPSWWNN